MLFFFDLWSNIQYGFIGKIAGCTEKGLSLKKMSRSLIIYIIMLFMSLTACNQRNDVPSDDMMIELYENNETAFEAIREITGKYNSFHYPLFDKTDSIEISVSSDDRNILDSILRKLGVQRIFYHNKDSIIKPETDNIEIELLYYSWGLSVSG